MSLRARLAKERETRSRHIEPMPFVNEAAGWHASAITAGEEGVLGIFSALFERHEEGRLSGHELLNFLDSAVSQNRNVLWLDSFTKSDEGPAASVLEELGFARSLNPEWVSLELTAGHVEEVLDQARLQATARALAEKFVPVWLVANGVTLQGTVETASGHASLPPGGKIRPLESS